MNKKVSIIMPCYNQGAFVKEAIESVLNQTYQNIEIVCVNDASSDDSAEIIQDICAKEQSIPLIFIDHTENKGVIATRNEAIDVATGEYILPLDADDTLEPTFVEKAVKILDENPDIGIVYCWANNFMKGMKSWISKWEDFDVNKEIYVNTIVNSSMYRKSDFIAVGGYKTYMNKGLEDWDLWLSFIEKGLKGYLIKEPLFNYRRQIPNSRSIGVSKCIDELYYTILKHHTDLYINNELCVEKLFKLDYELIQKQKARARCIRRYIKMFFEVIFLFIMFYLIVFLYLIL